MRALVNRLPLTVLLAWMSCTHAEHYTIPLLVPATTSDKPQGVLRIVNASAESGTVDIYAIDDSGARSGPATFTLNASAAVAFTATDLQSGNANLGLTGGVGAGTGDLRLQIETELDIVPLAFVRAPDRTLSAMHDTVRGETMVESGQFRYEAPLFNPSIEATRESRLRLINPGDAAAAVTIGGVDDSGSESIGGEVALTLAAGGAKTLTALQLEAGDSDLTGRLGAGAGTWRLTVSSDQPLQVVNIVASTAGYWNNLSTTAVPGAAPADQAGFNERFVGSSVAYQAGSDRSTLEAQDNGRFAETTQADGFTVTYMGTYSYTAIGPDAGRLTLDYGDENACQANLYFSYRTSGWFASDCTSRDNPDGYWTGGSWFVESEGDDGQDGVGEIVETTFGVDDMLPGVPTSGNFDPASTGGGSQVTATADGTTITLDIGGFIELDDGTRYTCVAADGCTIVNGAVTAGTVDGRAAGMGEVDRFPTFRTAMRPGDQTYTVDAAIDTLTLPEAIGGNGTLKYTLSPRVPGLMFNASMRQVTGTPSTAGSHAMTYTVADEDGDTDTFGFTITVSLDPNDRTENGSSNSTPPALVARGSSFRVALDWRAPILGDDAQLTGYSLYRGDGDTCDNLAVIQEGLAPDLLYAEDNTVSSGATYCYRLTATDSADNSLSFDEIVVRALAPEMPTDLQVTSSSASMIGLSWTAPPDDGGGPPYGFNVYRCQGADCRFEGETWLAWVTDGTAYTDDGSGSRPLIAQSTYRYAVATSRAGEISVWSNWVAATAADTSTNTDPTPSLPSGAGPGNQAHTWRGVDLSYVNEMEDCGAVYRLNGEDRDPHEIFTEIGANVVRLRLWHTPDWTRYSTLSDVTRSIRRAKAQGMAVLLDFHYSDDWADPTNQVIPAAWRDIGTTQGLARALYDYTYNVLSNLDSLGLAPEYVQVGNEINTAILQPEEASSATIHWTRQAALLNAGIRAVRDFGAQSETNPRIMLHVAGPENVGWFFDAATAAGVNDFDIIGFSYYPGFSNVSLIHIDETVTWMRNRYGKDIVVAETAYPWTLTGNDSANNLGGQDWLIEGYPASTDGQRRYNIDLMQEILDGGGLGTIYWEPAWISTRCSTRWGQGSHWENQTFFDYENSELHEGADYLSHDYQ